MNSYNCGTLGLGPLGALSLGEGGSHLASGQLTGSWVCPCEVEQVALSRSQALGATGCQAPLVPCPTAQGGSRCLQCLGSSPLADGFLARPRRVSHPRLLLRCLFPSCSPCCAPSHPVLFPSWIPVGNDSPSAIDVLGWRDCPSPGTVPVPGPLPSPAEVSPATPPQSIGTSGSAGAPSCRGLLA